MLKFGLVTSFLLAALLALPAYGATFYVSNANDSGQGSLRQAITDANHSSASGIVYVQFDRMYAPIELLSSLPTATRNMEIRGKGYPYTPVIDGQGQYPIFRVSFNSASGSPSFTLSNLKLQNGHSRVGGGCLRLDNIYGFYIVEMVDFTGCSTNGELYYNNAMGGAIFGNGGTLIIALSNFVENRAENNSASGGAIYFTAIGSDNVLTITNSKFIDNIAKADNSAAGAIKVSRAATTITDSIFHGNRSLDNVYEYSTGTGGAIVAKNVESLTIRRSVFIANQARAIGAIDMSLSSSFPMKPLVLVNNTFVRNHASSGHGTIKAGDAKVTLRNNSFFANQGGSGFTNNFFGQDYDNVGINLVPTYQFYNNLFTNRFAGSSCELSGAFEMHSDYNIIPTAECALSSSTNIQTAEANLQGYRIDTQWPYAVLNAPLRFFADSPALDAGSPLTPDDDNVSACPTKDGLGKPRARDGDADGTARCDIGAFEWQHEAPLFADDLECRLQEHKVEGEEACG